MENLLRFGLSSVLCSYNTANTTRKSWGNRKMTEHTKFYLPEGELSRQPENRSWLLNRTTLELAAQKGVILEAPCTLCDCRSMSLRVRLPDGIHGVIPRSEACWQPGGMETRDIAIITRVGKQVQFKIREIYEDEKGETTAVLSRKAAQLECMQNYLAHRIPGDILPAKVTHLEPFGAFCDVGCGIISLLTVDRISVSRIAHPSDRFQVGACIHAVIASVEENGRMNLSHRELLGTWEENASRFSAGQTVTGIIRSVEEYGVFVELAPNLAGLAELCDGAVPGEQCAVYIKSILPERMKIKLVMIDMERGESERMHVHYYIDPTQVRHLDRWQYSPDGCRKRVETVFCENRVRRETSKAPL